MGAVGESGGKETVGVDGGLNLGIGDCTGMGRIGLGQCAKL